MKYISRIIFTVGLVFGLTACTEDAFETPIPELSAKGDMPVNLTFTLSDATAQTRSKVSGTETTVTVMQMVCFDANGLYLGIRNADVTSNGATTNPPMWDTGTIKGTVPQGTSRIHFIANRGLPVTLSFSVGTPEADVMMSEELSTKFDDTAHQKVCYWGYHKEANATAMEGWLNPEGPEGQVENSKVYMIRDRAKIVLTYEPTEHSADVTKIEWLIHNGRERGYLAPKKDYWKNDDEEGTYHGYNTVGENTYHISTAGMNEYTDCDRYSLWIDADNNDEENFDTTYDKTNGGNKYVPQFLFDDDNEAIDDLKAILRVTYTVDGNGNTKTVYHVLKLNDDDKVLYDVVRNNTYYINVRLLSPDVGFYLTLEDAINGDEFINADIEVDRNITSINDENYTLQILLPTETTSIVFNTTGENTMDFAFRQVNNVSLPGSTNPDEFEVKWEKSQTFCDNELGLSYNEDTKQFTITATVNQVTSQLQDQWIEVKHKESGLTRYIHVYVIDQFRYLENPTLKAEGNDYVLSFKIPPLSSENPNDYVYPIGLYPIDVKFTTNTLNAYGTTLGTEDYGLFGVAVEPTLKDTDKHNYDLTKSDNFETGYKSPVSSTANNDRTHWYYQQSANPWDFWYTYSIKNYDEYTNNGEVKIYFKDVHDHIKYANVTDLGLFMEIKYFGKIYSMPVTN